VGLKPLTRPRFIRPCCPPDKQRERATFLTIGAPRRSHLLNPLIAISRRKQEQHGCLTFLTDYNKFKCITNLSKRKSLSKHRKISLANKDRHDNSQETSVAAGGTDSGVVLKKSLSKKRRKRNAKIVAP